MKRKVDVNMFIQSPKVGLLGLCRVALWERSLKLWVPWT